MRIVVWTRLIRTPLRYRLGPFHHQRSAFFADVAGWFCFNREVTLRVVGTAVEWAEAAAALDDLSLFALWAFHAGRVLKRGVGVLLDVFTFGVVGTRDEAAITAIALNKHAAAFRTRFAGFFGSFEFFAFDRASALAVGEARAGKEFAGAAELDHHGGAAYGAL